MYSKLVRINNLSFALHLLALIFEKIKYIESDIISQERLKKRFEVF